MKTLMNVDDYIFFIKPLSTQIFHNCIAIQQSVINFYYSTCNSFVNLFPTQQ